MATGISTVTLPRKSLFGIFTSNPRSFVQRYSHDLGRYQYYSAVHRCFVELLRVFSLGRYLGVRKNSYRLLCICVNPVSRRIGPNDLTLGILSNDKMIAPTITDTLFHQEKIQKNKVAVSFVPTNSFPTVNGELTFGGIDSTKFIGELHYL